MTTAQGDENRMSYYELLIGINNKAGLHPLAASSVPASVGSGPPRGHFTFPAPIAEVSPDILTGMMTASKVEVLTLNVQRIIWQVNRGTRGLAGYWIVLK